MKHTNQGCIYLLRNTVNGMCYVGQSVYNPPIQRIAQHVGHGFYYDENGNRQSTKTWKGVDNNQNPRIRADIEAYGKEVFEWEILRDNVADTDLDDFEAEEIARYNSMKPKGYNGTRGVNRKMIDKHNPELIPQFVNQKSDWHFDKERNLWCIYDPNRESCLL